MFKYKDRNLKEIQSLKKKNCNKVETKGDIKNLKNQRGTFCGDLKVVQQHLNDEFDVKVHKNTLRSIQPDNKVKSTFDEELGCNKMVGNI